MQSEHLIRCRPAIIWIPSYKIVFRHKTLSNNSEKLPDFPNSIMFENGGLAVFITYFYAFIEIFTVRRYFKNIYKHMLGHFKVYTKMWPHTRSAINKIWISNLDLSILFECQIGREYPKWKLDWIGDANSLNFQKSVLSQYIHFSKWWNHEN